jgi:hypothetical protein
MALISETHISDDAVYLLLVIAVLCVNQLDNTVIAKNLLLHWLHMKI